MEFDPSTLSHHEQSKLLNGSVIPRPIALVTTLGRTGSNAAPFSYFTIASINPPVLAFAIGITNAQRNGSEKDTLTNLRELPEFVVHVVSRKIKDGMNVAATEFPETTDEIVRAGFTAVPSTRVKPMRIAESPVAFECRLIRLIELGRAPFHLALGEVVYMHFHEGVVDKRLHVDATKIDPVARLGAPGAYSTIADRFVMPIPGQNE